MGNSLINIAILESSQIVSEGIQSILFQSDKAVKVYRINCLDELDELSENRVLDVLIVSSLLIVNLEKEIKKIRKSYPKLLLVGIDYGLMQIPADLLDGTFTLYDSSEYFINLLSQLNEEKRNNKTDNSDEDELTEREKDILKGIVNGMSNKEIADSLTISIHTVISHRKNIAAKTGIRSQSGLTIYAISKKIIAIEEIDLNNH